MYCIDKNLQSFNTFSIRNIEACVKGLESARIYQGKGKGLFAATTFDPQKCRKEVTSGDSPENDNNYSLAWVRDTLKCSHYDLVAGNSEHLKNTMSTLLTYFRNNIQIIDRAIEDNKKNRCLSYDYHAILPRMHPETLERVHADQKKDLQLDMAEILKHLSLISHKGICVLKDIEDISLVLKLIDYFKAWDYSRNANPPGDFGIWEEGKEGTKGSLIPVIHSSSIAAVLSGFIHINGLTLEAEDGSTKIVSIPEEIIHNGFEFLNERISLVGECEERPYDLTSLIILYDHLILKEMGKGDLLTKDNETKILNEFALLERDYGFMRYASEKNPDDLDDYHKPQKKSAEWTMGFGYAALIYEKLGQLKKALKYVEKMEKTFDWETGLGLPEAYFGGTNRPVPISPLSWSNALYLVTYETIRKHTENELAIQ